MNASNAVKLAFAAAILLATTGVALAKERTTGRGTGPVVYVASQGLYYDSIVLVDPLPMKGRFQELYMGENGPTTDYGPGDHGHVGGRWWIDLDEDGAMGPDDMYFLCPLLGPGRPAP